MILLLLWHEPYVPADPVTAMLAGVDDVQYFSGVDDTIYYSVVDVEP